MKNYHVTKQEDDKAILEECAPPKVDHKPEEITAWLAKSKRVTWLITRIQARRRGLLSRRLQPIRKGIKTIGIVKYVGQKLRDAQENVQEIEKKLGQYFVEWEPEKFAGTHELRKLIVEETGTIYCGYWNIATNKKEGYGQQAYPNGEKYEGMWKDGEQEGKGRYIYDNGDYYEGNWIKGKANGQGTLKSADGFEYTGEWKDNNHNGHG